MVNSVQEITSSNSSFGYDYDKDDDNNTANKKSHMIDVDKFVADESR